MKTRRSKGPVKLTLANRALWAIALGSAAAMGGCGDDEPGDSGDTSSSSSSASSSTGASSASTASSTSGSSGGFGGEGGAGGEAGTTASSGSGAAGGGGAGGQGGSGGSAACAKTAPDPTRGGAIAISPDDDTLVAVNRDVGTVTVLGVDYADGLPAFTKKAEIAVGGRALAGGDRRLRRHGLRGPPRAIRRWSRSTTSRRRRSRAPR